MLRIIWLGSLADCAQLAEYALHTYAERYTQVIAGRAICAAGDAAMKARYAEFVKANCATLPNTITVDAIDALFLADISVVDLLDMLARIDVTDAGGGLSIEWQLPGWSDRIPAQSANSAQGNRARPARAGNGLSRAKPPSGVLGPAGLRSRARREHLSSPGERNGHPGGSKTHRPNGRARGGRLATTGVISTAGKRRNAAGAASALNQLRLPSFYSSRPFDCPSNGSPRARITPQRTPSISHEESGSFRAGDDGRQTPIADAAGDSAAGRERI